MKHAMLTTAELLQLNQEVLDGNTNSRHQLILAYRPFIRKLMNELVRELKFTIEDRDELMASCLCHLFEKVHTYKPNHGSFTAFLYWPIRNAVLEYVGQNHFVAVVAGQTVRDARQVQATIVHLREQGIEPTLEHVMSQCGLNRDVVARHIAIIGTLSVPVSLSTPVSQSGDEDATLFGDVLVATDVSAVDLLHDKQVTHVVQRALAVLDDRKRYIIQARMGIGVTPQTLDEVGQIFGVSKERIRQLEAEAIQELRHYFSRRNIQFEDLAAE